MAPARSQSSDSDPFNLSRFLEAQQDSYDSAETELAAGRKRSHWMWFVFPQIDGLGTSPTAKYYAMSGAAEASKYLEHPVLGKRLIDCTKAMIALEGKSAAEILGTPDDLKFCSCMTLFETVAGPESVFAIALDKYFAGRRDRLTLTLLRQTRHAE